MANLQQMPEREFNFYFSTACLTESPVFELGGRWYISLGRPGFNSKANNRTGYASEKAALRALERFSKKE